MIFFFQNKLNYWHIKDTKYKRIIKSNCQRLRLSVMINSQNIPKQGI